MVTDQPLEDEDVDPETGTAIRIPCNPTFDIPQPSMIPPADLDRYGRPLSDRQRSKDLKSPTLQFRILARLPTVANDGTRYASRTSQVTTLVLRRAEWRHGRRTLQVLRVGASVLRS